MYAFRVPEGEKGNHGQRQYFKEMMRISKNWWKNSSPDSENWITKQDLKIKKKNTSKYVLVKFHSMKIKTHTKKVNLG